MKSCSAFVALGANLPTKQGDPPRSTIERAVDLLDAEPGIAVVRVSSLIDTQPLGGPPGQPAYLNGAVEVATGLQPEALLQRLQAIEDRLGRARTARWGPRTVDLDLLLFESLMVRSERLTVPHLRLHERLFVLEPLCEIAPDVEVPGTGGARRRASELLDALRHGATISPWNGFRRSPRSELI